MSTKLMKITDEKQWLEKRKGYITSTQIAGLFGLQAKTSPTYFELYHITRGNLDAATVDNNYTVFGKLMEKVVCEMVLLEKPEWKIEEYPYFAYDDEDHSGSSFDRAVWIGGKKYLMEIKTTSHKEYKEKFIEHDADDIEATTGYECQMQFEMEMVKDEGFAGIVMVVFIADTRQLRYIFRTRDADMCKEMRRAVVQFWDLQEPPAPDFERDKSLIAQLCPALDPKHNMDATENNHISVLCAQIATSKKIIKLEEKAAKIASAELLTLAGNAKYIWTKEHKVTLSDIKANLGKQITAEMVGTVTGQRVGYKKMAVKAIDGSEEEDDE